MKIVTFILVFLATFECFSSDSANNAWEGCLSDFIVYSNSSVELSASGAGRSYVTLPNKRSFNTIWDLNVRLSFNPSSGNYADIYLCANESDLTSCSNGYFVRIGYTDKNICLYRKTETRAVKIIAGEVKRLDMPESEIEIKVECTVAGEWNVYSRLKGEDDFKSEGQTVDHNFPETNYFGILCVYTVTRNNGFCFDEISMSVLDEETEKETADLFAPTESDVIFNEVLFDADSASGEYVEFYNRSNKKIDLSCLTFALRNKDGNFTGKCRFSNYPKAMYPGTCSVLTKNIEKICTNRNCCNDALFMELSLPALNNNGADLVLIGKSGNIIDEFSYSPKMHEELIYDKKGIALERVDPDKQTQDPKNWRSASFDSGFGTPGCQNSQYFYENGSDDLIRLEDEIISLSAGDRLLVNYRFREPISSVDVFIYNVPGILIKRLFNNVIPGISGNWEWSNEDMSGLCLQTGIYILYIRYVTMSGIVKYKKTVFTLKS